MENIILLHSFSLFKETKILTLQNLYIKPVMLNFRAICVLASVLNAYHLQKEHYPGPGATLVAVCAIQDGVGEGDGGWRE